MANNIYIITPGASSATDALKNEPIAAGSLGGNPNLKKLFYDEATFANGIVL